MVTFSWPPSNRAGVWRPVKFAKYLPRYGWHPTVVTAADADTLPLGTRREDEGPCCPVYRVGPVGDRQIARGISVLLSPVARLLGKDRAWLQDALTWRLARCFHFPDAGTTHNRWLLPIARRAVQLARTGRFSAVYVTAPPYSMTLAGIWISIATRVPVVMEFRDPWTQNFAYGYRGVWDKLSRWLEAQAIAKAAAVVVLTPRQDSDLAARYPAHKDKIAYISNGFDPEDIPRLAPSHEGRFVVTLLGASYDDPSVIFQAISQVAYRDAAFRKYFTFRWVGADRAAVRMVRRHGVQGNVELWNRLAHGAALRLASLSHALWLEVPLNERAEYVVRGKTFEYLALGRPLLGTAPEGACTRAIVGRACRCRLIASRRPEDIASMLAEAFQDWKRGKLESRTNEIYVSQFRRDVLARELARILDDVAGRTKPSVRGCTRKRPGVSAARLAKRDGKRFRDGWGWEGKAREYAAS